jgi:two-component system sensor histidine kinase DctS
MRKLPTLPTLPLWSGQKWRWLMPIFLVLMFLATAILLPWQARRLEHGERQEQLIADTLWLEHKILFQINRNEEIVYDIASDIMKGHLPLSLARERFQQLLKSNYEIHRIDWLDEKGKTILSSAESEDLPATYLTHLRHQARQPVQAEHRHCLPPPAETLALGSALLSCAIPLLQGENLQGYIIISYRLQGILDNYVPWWVDQTNQISLLDENDKVLVTRAAVAEGQHVYTHNRPLELSGQLLYLRIDSTKGEPALLSNLWVVSVLGLALCLLWSQIALWRDISRRLMAEGALRQQVAFSTAMENSIIVGMRARDMAGHITYVNPAFCAMVGYPAEQILGQFPPMLYWAPEAIEQDQARFDRMMAGQVSATGIETIYQRANGERFPVLVHDSPLINEAGQQTGWMSSILDISELKRVQELTRKQQDKLELSARLATIGEIGSTLAHELNQPLAAISSYASGAMNMISAGNIDPPALLHVLQRAQEQAQRAGQVMRSVHEFVKKREAKREPLDLKQLILRLLPLIELQAKTVQVRLEGALPENSDGPSLPIVLADRILIEQVVLNLTRNGMEAMAQCPPEQRILRIRAERLEAPPCVQVAVIDRGSGITPQVAGQLFAPFFTTKKNGMGMGLNICRSAIEFHGGTLEYRANPEGGTLFTFSLPLGPMPDSGPSVEPGEH